MRRITSQGVVLEELSTQSAIEMLRSAKAQAPMVARRPAARAADHLFTHGGNFDGLTRSDYIVHWRHDRLLPSNYGECATHDAINKVLGRIQCCDRVAADTAVERLGVAFVTPWTNVGAMYAAGLHDKEIDSRMRARIRHFGLPTGVPATLAEYLADAASPAGACVLPPTVTSVDSVKDFVDLRSQHSEW